MRWFIRLTSKRRATIPARLLEALHLGPGDVVELVKDADGRIYLQAERIHTERLAPLRGLVRPGTPDFDIAEFREGTYDPSLRS